MSGISGPVVGFEARHAPLVPRESEERYLAGNAWSERILWSAIQDVLVPPGAGKSSRAEGRPIVEFRLRDDARDGRVRLHLNIYNVHDNHDAVHAVAGALPIDYGWSKVLQPEPALAETAWSVCRIERRLNFVDLPWRLIDTLQAQGDPSVRPGSDWFSEDDRRRELITRTPTQGELRFRRLCIPVLGALAPDRKGQRGLFQEMRERAPCHVSIALSAIEPGDFDECRRIAMFWGANLQPFSARFANAGFDSAEALNAQYDRFLLPDRFFVALSIRVAAATPAAVRAVALHVCARIGGLRSFKIHAPHSAPLEALWNPWTDIPHRGWDTERQKARRGRFREQAQSDGVALDSLEQPFEDFLIRLPHLYTIEEAAGIAALPLANEEGLPGFDARLVPPFSESSSAGAYSTRNDGEPQATPAGRLRIGKTVGRAASQDPGATAGEWHTIAPLDLTKHAFIVGSTGSGKTQTTLFLLRELDRLRINFLVIEPVKSEYYDALHDVFGGRLKRFRFEGDAAGRQAPEFLPFDPMRLQPGVSVARHASYLKSCFEAAFPLDPVLALILESGLRNYYLSKGISGCGLEMFSRGSADTHFVRNFTQKDPSGNVVGNIDRVFPSLQGFQRFFLDHFLPQKIVKIDQKIANAPRLVQLLEEWRQVFERRFEALSAGMIGMSAAKADNIYRADREKFETFSQLLDGPCVVELDGIPDNDQKALMMAFLLTFLFERRQADALEAQERGEAIGNRLRHILVLEEAHRVLANPGAARRDDLAGAGAKSSAVSLFTDMLAEIRSFGQGLVVVEQIPTKIVPEAVKNTNLKIMLRLTSADDRNFLGEAMNFTEDQKRFVTGLRAEPGVGIDMVVFEQQLDQPKLLRLPLDPMPPPDAPRRPAHHGLFADRAAEGPP